jgi:hypothetical protein
MFVGDPRKRWIHCKQAFALEPCTGRAARGPGRALSLIWPKIKDDIIELHNGHT